MSRVFVAGASGVLGRALVPLLVADGHDVVGLTRSPGRAALVASLGAEPEVANALDGGALRIAVERARPELVVSLLTDLATADFAANSRLRREGMRNLVSAALAAGAGRLAAESIAFSAGPDGDSAVAEMERLVLETPGLEGLVLRYGRLYGPGTWNETDLPEEPRVSVEAAAHATIAALAGGARGIVEISD